MRVTIVEQKLEHELIEMGGPMRRFRPTGRAFCTLITNDDCEINLGSVNSSNTPDFIGWFLCTEGSALLTQGPDHSSVNHQLRCIGRVSDYPASSLLPEIRYA